MKKISTIIIIWLSLVNMSFGQYYIYIPNDIRYEFSLTKDFNSIRFDIADTIASELGAKALHIRKSDNKCYLKRNGPIKYSFCFVHQPITFKSDTTFLFKEHDFSFTKGETGFLYGFTTSVPGFGPKSLNVNRFLMSSYKQITDSLYASNPQNFITLPNKSRSEYWRRNMINIGYGFTYLGKDNPYMNSKGFMTGFGYTWEAIHYLGVMAGLYYGNSINDKLSISATSIGLLVFWKVMFGLINGNNEFNNYNNFTRNRFAIPASHGF